MQYWEIKKKRGEQKKRNFRVYADVYSLFRSIRQAIEVSRLRRIPALEDLNAFSREVNMELDVASPKDVNDLQETQKSIQKILDELRFVQTIELREAREKTAQALRLRDCLNRLNISASCSRLVAVRNRLKERIENIIGWLQYYAKWGEAISIFLKFHEDFLPSFLKWLTQLVDCDVYGNAEKCKDELTVKHLEGMLQKIEHVDCFGGWKRWAHQCKKDIESAVGAVCSKKYDEAVEILKRVREAVKLKILQYQIHHFLLAVDFGQLREEFESDLYKGIINDIQLCLHDIDENGFRTPVKEKISILLSKAKALLMEEKPGAFIKEGKEALRLAYRTL